MQYNILGKYTRGDVGRRRKKGRPRKTWLWDVIEDKKEMEIRIWRIKAKLEGERWARKKERGDFNNIRPILSTITHLDGPAGMCLFRDMRFVGSIPHQVELLFLGRESPEHKSFDRYFKL